MDTAWYWSTAAVIDSLMCAATLGLAWAIGRRAPQRRQVWLLAALGWLAAHYAVVATEDFLHASGAITTPISLFSIAGNVLIAFAWSCICLYLLSVVQRYELQDRVDRTLWWSALAAIAIFTLPAIVGISAVVHLIAAGAPEREIQQMIARVANFGVNFGALWILAPAGTLNLLFQRVPNQDRTGWVAFLAPRSGGQLTSLQITQYPEIHSDRPKMTRTDIKSLGSIYLTGFILMALADFRSVEHWTPALILTSAVLRILILPSVFGLVYYQTRLSFFDLVLKRGTMFVLLAAIVCGAAAAVPRIDTPPTRAAFTAGATLFVCGAASVWDRADRLLDRIIFNRPNYRAALRFIGEQMARCVTRDALTAMITGRLQQTLRADWVEYAEQPRAEGRLVVAIGAPGRPRGFLAFGPRWRGQQYASEDLSFLDAVAAQFAAALENLEARELEQLVSTAELRALRAQINPHFLFNALNTLAEMAHADPKLEHAVLNLSRVFRYALESTRRDSVPLGDEIAAVRAYLEIEAIRFEDKLKYDIEVPGDLMDEPVPPMLIQPLVENSLKHGIAQQLGGGSVRVTVSRATRGLRVVVADNGAGFDPQHTAMNVGLSNVRARVEKTGGAWSLESKPGAGTTIAFEVTP